MDNNQIKNFLETSYDFSVLNQEVIQDTDYNLTLKIQTEQKKYFVRLGKIIPAAEVQEEVGLLVDMKIDFQTPKPLINKEGRFVSIPGFCKTCVVFDFIEGTSFHDPEKVPSAKQSFNAGAALYKLHYAASNQVLARAHKNLTSEIDEFLNIDLNYPEKFYKELEQARDQATQLAQVESYLVHGDYRIKNIIWNQSSERVLAVVDFEWYFAGPKEYDLGLMLVEWSFPDGGKDFDMQIIENILSGYNQNSKKKYVLSELKFWMYYLALCDTITFLKRKATKSSVADPFKSYMYIKAQKVLELNA